MDAKTICFIIFVVILIIISVIIGGIIFFSIVNNIKNNFIVGKPFPRLHCKYGFTYDAVNKNCWRCPGGYKKTKNKKLNSSKACHRKGIFKFGKKPVIWQSDLKLTHENVGNVMINSPSNFTNFKYPKEKTIIAHGKVINDIINGKNYEITIDFNKKYNNASFSTFPRTDAFKLEAFKDGSFYRMAFYLREKIIWGFPFASNNKNTLKIVVNKNRLELYLNGNKQKLKVNDHRAYNSYINVMNSIKKYPGFVIKNIDMIEFKYL